jgi:hypothetical protein
MTSLPALAIEATALALPAADLEAAASFARQEKAPSTRAALPIARQEIDRVRRGPYHADAVHRSNAVSS